MNHPRDPRQRRRDALHTVDPLAAAVRLDLALGEMRTAQREHGPGGEQLAAAVQFGTTAPPITAREFADAITPAEVEGPPVGEWVCETCGQPTDVLPCRGCSALQADPDPEPPAPSVAPAAPAPAFRTTERPAVPIGDETTMLTPALAAAVLDPGRSLNWRSRHDPRSLNWRSRHDPRSLQFGVRGRLAGSAPLADRLWPSDWPTLDQGAEGACVGMAVAGWANTMHAESGRRMLECWQGEEEALELYRRAQQLDAVPGEDYAGTSVLAGMHAGVEAGLFGGYLWAFGTKDVAQAVLQRGPVVVGVPWLAGMYETGPGGLVKLEGAEVGGHALVVVGLRLKGPQGQPGPFFVWHNSWGDGYGDGGLGYIHHRDLALLLRGRGEAAIPTAETVIP